MQDELREREQEVASLSAAVKSYEAQIDGLQTILVAKVSQCNRLASEVKDICKQLRQAEAAAASDHAAMNQQLEQLSDRVAELEDDLADEQQREQQLEAQLAATTAKVCMSCAVCSAHYRLPLCLTLIGYGSGHMFRKASQTR